jgi:hypothetical protein
MSIPALLATPHTSWRKLLWLLGCAAFFALAYVGHRAATRPTPVESPVDQAVRLLQNRGSLSSCSAPPCAPPAAA